MARLTGPQRRAKQTTKGKVKTKKVKQKSTGKVITVYSYDGGKTWTKQSPKNKRGWENFNEKGAHEWGTNDDGSPRTQPSSSKQTDKIASNNQKKKDKQESFDEKGDHEWGENEDGSPRQRQPNASYQSSKSNQNKDNKGGGKEAKSEDLKIKKKRSTMRERMADKNRKIFGKNQAGEDIVTKLQEKHKAWKKARKEGKLDEWRKKYKK